MRKNIACTIILVVVVLVAVFIKLTFRPSQPEMTATTTAATIATTTTSVNPTIATSSIALNNTSSVGFNTSLPFSFVNYPDIHFKVIKITKVYDPQAEYNHFAAGIKNPALVTVDFEMVNNGTKTLNANYFQLTYEVNKGQGNQGFVAPYYIHTSYETSPLSSQAAAATFIIPNDQMQASLVVGIFPPIVYKDVEDLFSRASNFFRVDFENKIAWHSEG